MTQQSARPPERLTLGAILRPLEQFLRVEAASTALLVLAAAAALLWANTTASNAYFLLWQTPVPLQLSPWVGVHSVGFWINEGLMTFFFLLVGLEIRGELHDGVLSQLRVATLPVVAALGGIVAPALVYLALNSASPLRQGWAIPTATDIAFAVGVLTLLGRRVPRTLRVLLLTLAIVDDIGAIVIIALYYSNGFGIVGIAVCLGAIAMVLVLQRCGREHAAWYVLPGAILWYGLGRAGVHPTLAGVILGLLTPVRSDVDASECVCTRLKSALHPWVAFVIMPLFALANAGVDLHGLATASGAALSLGAGVVLGLVIGKPLGIVTAVGLCLRSGVCALPGEIRWRHLLVLGCLGGIGFTMSVFIAGLALPQPELLAAAKGAVLLASVAAASLGLLIGRLALE